ncbi:MAG: T9SS type A sorting domain-containing protein, partial [Candidatus Cloacimonetes bacterium]|nr:T9SS type A sorting domain-containing protein [Candidatus Cloacimonadota bacterium]
NPDVYPSQTGDGSIKLQYQTFNNVNSQAGTSHGNYCSIGIMDHTGLVGLEYTFNNSYPEQALPLTNQSSLFITTQNPLLQDPPIVGVSVTNLSYETSVDQIVTDQFDITNTGEADLRYRISRTYLTRNPEDYYSWSNSEEPGGPNFNWVNITMNGFDIDFVADDQMSAPISLGFNFPFWDETYSSVTVCSNGFLSFTGNETSYQNGEIPDDAAPNNIIAPFWDDFSPQNGGHVRFYPDGSHHRFIITYSDVPHYNTNDRVEFQVILYENGRIDFQYNELNGNSESATVGIENIDGSEGIQLAYNETFIQEGLAVSFTPNLNWISVNPVSGTVPQGQSDQIQLTINTTGMAFGNFACNLEVGSNDPTQPLIIIPVTLHVESNLPPMPPSLQLPLEDVTMAEDTMYDGINLNRNFIDPNFDPLLFTVTGNEHINVIIVNGEVALIPESNWSGSEQLVFTADDMEGRKNSRTTVSDTMLVTVTPVNDAPININYQPAAIDVVAGHYSTIHFVYDCYDPDSELTYTWRVNGNIQPVPDDSSTLDFNTGSGEIFLVVVQCSDELNMLTNTWRVDIDETGTHEIVEVANNELFQNTPNPFNPTTNIKFALRENGFVNVAIYDSRGRRVKTMYSGNLMHGIHTYLWDGKDDRGQNLASGVYFYRVESKEFTKTKKALMLK